MANIRTDSWAAQLTEDRQWELYNRAKQPNVLWTEVVQWAVEAFGLDRKPSQSAFYRWKAAMRKAEYRQLLKDTTRAKAEAVALGQQAVTPEELCALLMSLATIAITINDNVRAAKELLDLAVTAQRIALRRNKLGLHEHLVKIMETKIDCAKINQRILEHKEKCAIKEAKPARTKKLTPEERERKISEIFGFDSPPPNQEHTMHRSAADIVRAVRRNRRTRRSDT